MLATVILFSYNQEKYIKEAIEGALNQTYSPLEIIISDDASTDGTWNIIQDTVHDYTGSHKVVVRRNEKNLGINQHFNKLMSLVNGEYIIIMAGDDISYPDRVEKSVEILITKNLSGVFSKSVVIDSRGRETRYSYPNGYPEVTNYNQMIDAGHHGASGASMAWRREVIDLFGEIPETPLGEDSFVPFRCSLMKGFGYCDEILVKYREHDSNVSFWSAKNNSKSALSRKDVLKRNMDHNLQMHKRWKEDIEKAFNSDLISKKDYEFSSSMLNNLIQITYDHSDFLNRCFLSVLFLLFMHRRVYNQMKIKHAALKVLNTQIFMRYPLVYRFSKKFKKLYVFNKGSQ